MELAGFQLLHERIFGVITIISGKTTAWFQNIWITQNISNHPYIILNISCPFRNIVSYKSAISWQKKKKSDQGLEERWCFLGCERKKKVFISPIGKNGDVEVLCNTEANKKLCVERRGSSPTIALKSQHDLGHAILDSAKTVLIRSGKFPLGHLFYIKLTLYKIAKQYSYIINKNI